MAFLCDIPPLPLPADSPRVTAYVLYVSVPTTLFGGPKYHVTSPCSGVMLRSASLVALHTRGQVLSDGEYETLQVSALNVPAETASGLRTLTRYVLRLVSGPSLLANGARLAARSPSWSTRLFALLSSNRRAPSILVVWNPTPLCGSFWSVTWK